jgi:DNA-binding transcriptional ArsR family regulator
VLKQAGLVTERREGTKRLYRARPEGLAELRAFLDEFWSDRLDVLVREAQREERRRKRDGASSN